MLKSQDEEVLTLWSSMKTMRPIQKKKKMKRSSSLGKRVHQERRTVHSIKLGRKEIHQGEIRFWESIKLCEKKREGHQTRKDFNPKREREREREREKWMQEFTSSYERILIHRRTREIQDSMKDHSSWEGGAKMKIHQKQNSIKLRKMRKKKQDTFHKKKKVCSIKKKKMKMH